MFIITSFIIILIMTAILFIVKVSTEWETFLNMNKTQACPYGWGTYKDFVREFEDYKGWTTETNWEGSFFADNYIDGQKYYVHADILKFRGACMLLNPIDFYKAKKYLKKRWKEEYDNYWSDINEL